MTDAQQENTIYEIQLQADVVALTGSPEQSFARCRPFSVLALNDAHQVSRTPLPTTLRVNVPGTVYPFMVFGYIYEKVCTVFTQVQPAGRRWQRVIVHI